MDDGETGIDVCGVTADITKHDAKTEHGAQAEESMDIDDDLEGSETDAKLLERLRLKRSQENKTPDIITVSQSEECYDMTHKYRGYALLMNNERFGRRLKEIGLGDRAGSNIDERNLRRELTDLGFTVKLMIDRSAQSMKNACYEMAAKNHSQVDCFVCIILSHGDEGVVYGTDTTIEIKELVKPFKGDMCPSLIGKPKLFIIQACRGSQTDPGVSIDVTDAKGKAPSDDKMPVDEPQVIKLPIEADFLFAYSTVPGFYSWRNGMNGSWFIQALCQTLKEHGTKMEFRKILTRVNKIVAQNFQSNNPDNEDFHMMKQIPCITYMLTKDLYFNTKKTKRLF
ncbi:Caspase-3 [Mactra antiquata]